MKLLKFRSLSKAKHGESISAYRQVFDIIENHRFKLSDPVQFNDPFDCNIPFNSKSTNMLAFLTATIGDMSVYWSEKDELRAKVYGYLFENPLEIRKAVKEWRVRQDIYKYIFGKLRVCSFSHGDRILNPLLWAHYANSHDGICFEVEIKERDILKVDYRRKIPMFDVTTPGNEGYVDYVTSKGNAWKYEKEYRAVVNSQDNEYFGFDKEGLTSVYFGIKVEPMVRLGLIRKIRELGYRPDFYVMDLSPKRYALRKRRWRNEEYNGTLHK
jgi:hypothetical protein